MSKINFLKPDKSNLNTFLYLGSFLFFLSILDVSVNSFFSVNITSFFPDFLSFVLPLILGFIGLYFIRIELSGIKVDMAFVDYADILMPTGNFKEKRHAIGNIYEDLRGLAGELEIPIWTASQANRSALEEDVIGADKVAEDYSKVMTADFVMSMSRKVEDKIANTGRFHVIKNRFGIDGVTYPATINTNIGQVQIFEGSSQFGKNAQNKMNNSEEFLRKELKNKFSDMQKNIDGFE